MRIASSIESAAVLDVQEAYQTFLDGLPVRNPRKLLFINVPQVSPDLFMPEKAKQNGYYNYPPVGYLYLSAAAKLANPEIDLVVLDLNYEMLRRCHLGILDDVHNFWKELIAREIEASDQLHVCVGNNWAIVTPMFLAVTRFIKDNFKQVTLLTGGVETTQNYKRVVQGDYCHIAFRHDAEVPFRRFLESCQGVDPTDVPQAIAFKLNEEFYETEPPLEPSTEFLDIRPYYHLVEVENYHKYGGANPYSGYVGKEKIYGTLLASRGCRASCTYCAVLAFYPKGVRTRTARSVVDEIKFLMEEKGVRIIEWLDDDPTFGRQRSVEMFQLMAEELPPDLEWITNNGITGCTITEEIMYWMVKSGCKAFRVGVESGNEAMLRKIRKPATKDGLRKAGAIFGRYPQVFVGGNYIVGFPEETFGEMMDTYEFANELSWDWAHYFICQPAGGTPLFDDFQALGDPRCEIDEFEGLIPARLAQQSDSFGYHKGYDSNNHVAKPILSGRDIFKFPRDQVPSSEQIKEIWFTFNLLTNFFNNPNLQPGGNLEKIVRWFESIYDAYPRDASMCAMLAYGHRLLGNWSESTEYREKFHRLTKKYAYWKRRISEFPELLSYADGGTDDF